MERKEEVGDKENDGDVRTENGTNFIYQNYAFFSTAVLNCGDL